MSKQGLAVALTAFVLAGCGSGTTKTVTVTTQHPTAPSQPATAAQQPTTTPATSTTQQPTGIVVLGSASFAPNGSGFGTEQPAEIFNGGDPSGHVRQIHWTNWGTSTAFGAGLSSIFKPQGGYYPDLVSVRLRADDLGSCSPGGPPAYRQLSVQEPSTPGGALGPWMSWSGASSICSAP